MSEYGAFLPRRTRFVGVQGLAGYRIKTYHIAFAAPDIDAARFDAAVRLAELSLPHPDVQPGRPGVGFLILHQGNGADYAVLGWWDRGNELPIRLFVREQRDGARWRSGEGSESFCVWDLEVIWHERQAFVAAYLTPAIADPEARYLSDAVDVLSDRPHSGSPEA